MPRPKKISVAGLGINLDKIRSVRHTELNDYEIQMEAFTFHLPPEVGFYIMAAWNRHMWESVVDMDFMLDNLQDHYNQVVQELETDGPYLKDKLIYSVETGKLAITRVP